MALGAQVGDVRWQVTKEGMLLALVGVGVGLAGALAVTRLLRTLLFGVAPSDPITLIGAAATMVLVAAVASAVPAWRASRMDPMRVLRGE